MSTLIVLTVYLFVIGISYNCWRRARLEKTRQDLYRLRDNIFDRIMMKELSFSDKVVVDLLRYVHGLVYVMEHLTIVHVFIGMVKASEHREPVVWLDYPSVTREADRAIVLTVDAVRRMSPCIRLIFLLAECFGDRTSSAPKKVRDRNSTWGQRFPGVAQTVEERAPASGAILEYAG